mmetsp:Transcript_3985/g.12370  ORF Transcript_3985/g.12370 Transcript_3985/m.12370 type:complete len:198 (-) Transcript_3985:360-953(-)
MLADTPWPQDDARSAVEDFTGGKKRDTTMALVGSAGPIQRKLLNDVLQGRTNVYNIYLDEGEKLDSAISRTLVLDEKLDLAASAKCIREVRQPLLHRPRVPRLKIRLPRLRRPRVKLLEAAPEPPKPAVVIIEAPVWNTDTTAVTNILKDSTKLTALGYGDITTIVIAPELDEKSLPTGLRDNLEIVRTAAPTATPT